MGLSLSAFVRLPECLMPKGGWGKYIELISNDGENNSGQLKGLGDGCECNA